MSTDITIARKSPVKANLEGWAMLLLAGGANSVDKSRVLCAPELKDNWLSVGGLSDDGHNVMFIQNACTLLKGASIVGRVEHKRGVTVMVPKTEVVWKGPWLQNMGAHDVKPLACAV